MNALKTCFSSRPYYLLFLFITAAIGSFCFSIVEPYGAENKEQTLQHLFLNKKWKGDFDGMVERRLIRVLVVTNNMEFFFHRGHYRGMTVDLLEDFEKFINERDPEKTLQISVIFLPVNRDQLIPALVAGIGDIAVGNVSIIEDRLRAVDFSEPFRSDVRKIVVANSQVPSLRTLEDLSGQNLYVRKSSSYYSYLLRLNKTLEHRGQPLINLVEVDENFEDTDLLQMVNNSLIPMIIVDDHIAEFWSEIFADIKLYQDIPVNEGGAIGWAFRKKSPLLAEIINNFLKTAKIGTERGNVIFNKYYQNNKWTRNSIVSNSSERYQSILKLFKKYASTYGFDYLLTQALAYQESQFVHNKRSSAGAVGIMQVLPETAADKNVGIPNIENLEANVHAGHRYLRFIQDRYFNDTRIDYVNKHLLTLASYNAGPKKILDIREETKERGFDPNIWFNNVELVVAEKVGRETVQYVSNIYKYYIAYKLFQEKAHRFPKKSLSLAQNTPSRSSRFAPE